MKAVVDQDKFLLATWGSEKYETGPHQNIPKIITSTLQKISKKVLYLCNF